MNNRQVASREYKVILNSEHFSNPLDGEQKLISQIERYLRNDERIIYLPDTRAEKYRWVQYLDTSGHHLRKNGYIFRVRNEYEPERKFKYTLKYRHNDRYLSAISNVMINASNSVLNNVEHKTKFEQDVIYGFKSKFAHSTSVGTDSEWPIASIDDLLNIFPGLEILKINKSTLLQKVHFVDAFHETKVEAGLFSLGKKKHLKVKPCISYWNEGKDTRKTPIICEFSYDYDLPKNQQKKPEKLENYRENVVSFSNELFEHLSSIADWITKDGTTKTAYAYQQKTSM